MERVRNGTRTGTTGTGVLASVLSRELFYPQTQRRDANNDENKTTTLEILVVMVMMMGYERMKK